MRVFCQEVDFTPTFNWLLEVDCENPAVRFIVMRDLLGVPAEDREIQAARQAVMRSGAVPAILAAQNADGSWTPRSGVFQVTDMQLLILAEMGMDEQDERVQRACRYALDHYIARNGAFAERMPTLENETYHCKNAMMVYALRKLRFGNDERVRRALDWEARAVTGDWNHPGGFYENGTCGPGFACAENGGLPCAWGAIKSVRALQAVPATDRTPLMHAALRRGIEFLLSHDIAKARYPHPGRVSPMWFKFGFPFNDWSDLLELCQVLADQGFGQDAHLKPAIQRVLDQHNADGCWSMGRSLNGMMWVDIEKKGRPSKWVTLRALRMLKTAGWLSGIYSA